MNEFELDLNIVRDLVLEIDTNIYHGADGATFIPSVSSAGVISWTNDQGYQNPDPVNIKGPQGEQGYIFTPSVSSAGVISWTNDGDLPNPQSVNIKGPQGDQGPTGATFTPSVSSAGVISWTNDKSLPNPDSVNIKGPQGDQGPAGVGVPSGGTTGQVLKKTSATDYATAWADDEGGLTILSYGSSTWAEFLAAYNKNAIVYCRASSNADPSIGTQGRMAFMAYVNLSGSTPTSVEFQYYRSVTTHSDAQQGDQVYVYKLDNAGTWTVTTREAYTKIAAGTALTSSYSSGVLTISNDAAVPSGGTEGQVLTVSTAGYTWADPSGANGLPSGGSSGQFLKKNSGTDYDAVWNTIYQVPTGGSSGQFLKKTGSGSADYGWNTIYQVPTGGSSGQFLKKTGSGNTNYAWAAVTASNGLPSGGSSGQFLKKNSGTDYDAGWQAGGLVPSGGAQGQVLAKTSATDYDVTWVTPSGIPSGGTTGQVLAKTSGTDYAASWSTPHYIPSGGSTGQVLKKSSNSDYAVSWGNAGGDLLVIRVYYDGSGGWWYDKTWDDIYDAVEHEVPIIGIYKGNILSFDENYWGIWQDLRLFGEGIDYNGNPIYYDLRCTGGTMYAENHYNWLTFEILNTSGTRTLVQGALPDDYFAVLNSIYYPCYNLVEYDTVNKKSRVFNLTKVEKIDNESPMEIILDFECQEWNAPSATMTLSKVSVVIEYNEASYSFDTIYMDTYRTTNITITTT